MGRLVWDQTGERLFEIGVDRAVLYLSDGTGVPWNGFVSMEEKPLISSNDGVFVDGVKVGMLDDHEELSLSVSALTYPDEFEAYDGFEEVGGVLFDSQPKQLFALSYRTLIGNDTESTERGYKIHLVYNAITESSDEAYETLSGSISATEFVWNLLTIPVEIRGFRPTAHIFIDSTEVHPELLSWLEDALYGTEDSDPHIPSMQDVIDTFNAWYGVVINPDGTWTATCPSDWIVLDGDMFTLNWPNAVIDGDNYTFDSI